MTQPSILVHQRGTAMLRSALGPAIGALLVDDRLSDGMADTGERLAPTQAERIIRLVAHHVGAEVHAGSPRVSAELPESGERFAGLLPPVVTAPVFSIRPITSRSARPRRPTCRASTGPTRRTN